MRERFNNIIKSIDMVLMNRIPEIDDSIWDNWESEAPDTDPDSENYVEIYQWFAINQSDAEYLVAKNQFVTYSEKLDTYFLAITHYGTAWNYVDSMALDFLGE